MSALARLTSMAPRPGADPLRRLLRRTRRALRREGGMAGRDRASPPLRLRGRPPALRIAALACAAAAVAGAGLAAAGLSPSRATPGEAAAAVAVPRWSEIYHPIALYDLPGTEFSKLPAAYRAQRREPDGAREDLMTFGQPEGSRPFLQLSLLRSGTGGEEPREALGDALSRLAGARRLMATRIRPAAPMDTRLGRFEAADLLLWDRGSPAPCLGFRGGGPVLRLAGFACGAPGRPMGRAALACAIDRIDLLSAGEDAALRAVFVAAERNTGATCLAGRSLAVAGRGGRLGWLDPDGTMPPLRGLFEATIRQR